MKSKLLLKYLLAIPLLILMLCTACNKEDDISVNEYFRIEQTDLQDWDFGIASQNNNVVLVKESDDDGSSHVLILMHQSGDTLSLTYQNDTLTDFHYNNYHFMVSEIDTLFLLTTIDGNMAVSFAIPSYKHVAKCITKGDALGLLRRSIDHFNNIFTAESGIHALINVGNGDWESFMHDLGEILAESELSIDGGPIGAGLIFGYELYKHYIDFIHNKAIRFHLGNATCVIQSVQQNELNNTIEVTVSVINGESIPNDYIWKNYWGHQVTSPNYVYYGVICRVGNNYPTIYKYDDYRKELLEPHSSITHTFSFPVMAVEKILFRSFLGFNYEYQNTALQNGHKSVALAKYGNVEAFYPKFEINTLASPSEGGTVTGGGRYNFNTHVTLTASANSGYKFKHWSDGSVLSTRAITVEGDATYTAYFEEYYVINTIASPLEGGTVSGSGEYPPNTTLIITATANSGYEFTHWEDGSESNPRVITVEGDATYTAYFEQELPDISGTWICTETHYSSSGEPSYTSYEITLYEDGTVDCPTYPVISEGLSPGTWSLGHNGGFGISILQLSYYINYWQESGVKWEGHVDNMNNPTTITGHRYNWNYNYVGYFEGDHVEMIMTR